MSTSHDDAAVETPSERPSRAWTPIHICALVAGLCHLSWIPATLESRLPSRTSYVSELLAIDQPWSWLLRTSDVVAGITVTVAALLLWRAAGRPARRATRTVRLLTIAMVGGLLLFGVGTALDAGLLPMSCATSVSAECAAAEAAGTVPLHHQLHTVSSTIASLGAFLGPVALAILLLLHRWPLTAHARALYGAAAAACAITTVWVLVEIAGAGDSPLAGRLGFGMVGWAQRLQVATWSLCLLLIPLLDVRSAAPPRRGRR